MAPLASRPFLSPFPGAFDLFASFSQYVHLPTTGFWVPHGFWTLLQMLQLIFGINLFSENPPLSFFMFLQPKEVMLLEWSYLVIEHYVAYEAYLLTAPGLLEDSSFLSPPSPPSRSHDEPEHEAHSQSPVSQRRQERLTYHQQINCKLILRLRNGKEQKRGLLGVRHKKGHRSRLAGHLSRRSPQPDQLELDIWNFQSINSKEESPLMITWSHKANRVLKFARKTKVN